MSAANAIGDFDLNAIQLRKKLEFPDGSIQTTAYTGQSGSENLQQVLTDGNNAGGLGITNLGSLNLTVGSEIIQPAATTSPFPAGNVLDATQIFTQRPAGSQTFSVLNNSGSAIQGVVMLPLSTDNIFNPIINTNDIAIIANATNAVGFCLTNDNTTTNGVRITDAAVTLGAGGTSDTPTQRIVCNSTQSAITLAYTNLVLSTGALPATSGASASLFLPVTINGVAYKIALLSS